MFAKFLPLFLCCVVQAQVKFVVQLDYDNSSCVTGKNCNAEVFRVTCPGGQCPDFGVSQSSFTKLTLTTTQTVSASNTHFISTDNGSSVALANNTTYRYAVRNAFQADPSHPGPATQATVLTPTGVHNAVLNWSSAACRTSSPCNIRVYRAVCASSTNCPAYVANGSAWKALNMSSGLNANMTAQSTSWLYTDSDAALLGNTTYAWVATVSYQGASTESPASTAYVGTTLVGLRTVKLDALEETK